MGYGALKVEIQLLQDEFVRVGDSRSSSRIIR